MERRRKMAGVRRLVGFWWVLLEERRGAASSGSLWGLGFVGWALPFVWPLLVPLERSLDCPCSCSEGSGLVKVP